MKLTRLVFVGFLGAAAFAQTAPAGKTHLKVGDEAPDFTLNGTNGKPMKLSDFRGKKTVVLAFFPAAFTGGCTKEMQAYASGFSKFEESNAEVFGVSTDNLPSQKHWAEQVIKTPVPLLSDFMRKVSTQYGVLMPERGVASRTTFVIDTEGKIQHIDTDSSAVDISGAATACSRLKKS